MEGRRPIVLMLRNHHFFEHEDETRATVEALRLARVHRGECVVYVPVAVAHPPIDQRVERLVPEAPSAEMAVTDGEVPARDKMLTRDEAFDIVLAALRTIPFAGVLIESLQAECCAAHTESNTPTLFDIVYFRRVLADMHKDGLITVSDGLVSLMEPS